MAAVGLAVKYSDNVMAARGKVLLAMIGEPEAAMRVEHDVVRPAQGAAMIAALVQHLHRAGLDIDPLDPPAAIIRSDSVGCKHAVTAHPVEPAIVAAIELSVGPHRQAVRAAARFGDRLRGAIRLHPRDAARLDLDQDDAAILHRHGSLGKAQSAGDDIHGNDPLSRIPGRSLVPALSCQRRA